MSTPQSTALSQSMQAPPRRSRLPFVLVIFLCCVTAFAVYVWSHAGSPRPLNLALVTWNDDPFWDPVIAGAQDAAQEWNVKLTTIRSAPSVDAQSKHLRNLLAGGIDGIAISPNNPQSQAALLNEAAEKTVLVTFDSDAPESKRRLFVGTDDYAAGDYAAEEVKQAIPDGGSVIISVGSLDTINGRARRQGVIDGLLGRPFDRDRAAEPLDAQLKGAKYSILATILDGGDVSKGKQLIADALKAHSDVKCIVGLFSYSAPVALEAIQDAGKTGQVKVIGFDDNPQTQAGIEAGTVQASIIQAQYRIGYETVRALAATVRGLDQRGPRGPRLIQHPIYVLKKDNIAQFRADGRIRQITNTASTQSTARP